MPWFCETVSLFSPGCPGTHFVDHASPELRVLPLPRHVSQHPAEKFFLMHLLIPFTGIMCIRWMIFQLETAFEITFITLN